MTNLYYVSMDTLKQIVGPDIYSIIDEYSQIIICDGDGGEDEIEQFKYPQKSIKIMIHLDVIDSPCITRIHNIEERKKYMEKMDNRIGIIEGRWYKTNQSTDIYQEYHSYYLMDDGNLQYLLNCTKRYIVVMNWKSSFFGIHFQRDGHAHMIHSDIIDYFQNGNTNEDTGNNKYNLKYIPNDRRISIGISFNDS